MPMLAWTHPTRGAIPHKVRPMVDYADVSALSASVELDREPPHQGQGPPVSLWALFRATPFYLIATVFCVVLPGPTFANDQIDAEVGYTRIVGEYLNYCSDAKATAECERTMPPKKAVLSLRAILFSLQKCSGDQGRICSDELSKRRDELRSVLSWWLSKEIQGTTLTTILAPIPQPKAHPVPGKRNWVEQAGVDINRAAINTGHAATAVVPKDINCAKAIVDPNWPWALGFMTAAKNSNSLVRIGITDKNTCLAKRAQLADEAQKDFSDFGRDAINDVGECLCTQVY